MGDERCGTTAGWNVHTKRGERPCEPCLEAERVYMRQWRADHPHPRGGRPRDKEQQQAYNAAQRELRERHRAEFNAIYAAQRATLRVTREMREAAS